MIKAAILTIVGSLVVQKVEAQSPAFRKVSVREVQADLQATLSTLLQGTAATPSKRVEAIQASAWKTFQALPKNSAGRLSPPAVRHIVHGYFAREHGWQIKGLEPHGMQLNVSHVHDVNIFQDKAPLLVEGLLESQQSNRGLALNDIVAMIAVLEQMMFDESVTLLEAAYGFNGVSMQDEISSDMLHRVLQSYLLLFGMGSKADLSNATRHQVLLASKKRVVVEEFEHDTLLNLEFQGRNQMNPFKPPLYSFQAAVEIMQNLAQQYGKWQNSECHDMRAHLRQLDPEVLGVVPLGLFYAQPPGSSYHFTESATYLRSIGALDETTPGNPKVLIANYVNGPSNCIASSAYYSVCCLSECDHILAELEHHVAAPAASPETLLELIGKVSDVALPTGLAEKLKVMAVRHGGQVPLHGRLFAQWLHFAFPHECPYPSVVQSATALTASEWRDGRSVASLDERIEHIEASPTELAPLAEDFDIEGRWSDYEVLPAHDQPTQGFGSGPMRTVVQVVAVIVALRSALAAWRGVASTRVGDAKKKDDDFVLALHV
jgi:hypothetical protein